VTDDSLRLPDPEAVPLDDIPTVLGRLETLCLQLRRRYLMPTRGTAPPADRLLSAAKAAERTGMSEDWLYRHADELPFTRRTSGRAVRFSEAGIAKWLASQVR
jgi:predicted DNA-binding transcriptional regulator AlpA